MWCPSFKCLVHADGERSYRVGHELLDAFLEFASGRARPNTVRAYAHDLKVFFALVGKEPAEVTPRDVLEFVAIQQRPNAGAENVVRISDGGAGLSAATIKRRLAAVSSLYGYLVTRGDVGVTRTRCHAVCRRARAAIGASVAWCRWCGEFVACRGSWNPRRSRR